MYVGLGKLLRTVGFEEVYKEQLVGNGMKHRKEKDFSRHRICHGRLIKV